MTLIVGTAAVIQAVGLDRTTQLPYFPALLAVMILQVVMLWTGRRVTRREAVVLLAVYGLHLVAVTVLILAASR